MDWDWLWIAMVSGLPLLGYYGPRLFVFIGGLLTGNVTAMSKEDEPDSDIK